MNLLVWIPMMFALGLVPMGICLVFIKACEKTLPVFVCGDLTLDFDLRQVWASSA